MDWGTLAGTPVNAGTLTIPGNSGLSLTGTLTNTGTILDTNTANITAGNAGNIVTTINNEAGATFNFQADGSLDSFNGETNTSFNNAGTLEKSAGTGISSFVPPVNNTARAPSRATPAPSSSAAAAPAVAPTPSPRRPAEQSP